MTRSTDDLIWIRSLAYPLAMSTSRWRLGRELGRGWFGTTFEASRSDGIHDPSVPDNAVVKQFDMKRADLAQVNVEQLMAKSFQSPYLVRTYDAFVDGSRGVIVMERCGKPLSAALSSGPIPAAEAWTLAVHLGYAMSALHVPGGVHNDLHAGNVLRCGEGWKIGDFGGVTTVTEGTHGPWRHGDRAIQPPECSRDPLARPTNDVWATGLLLHKALTGRSVVPRSPEAVVKLERGIIDIAADLPRALDRLVRSCLSVNREARPWSGVEYLQSMSRPRSALTTSRLGSSHVVTLDRRGKPWWKTEGQEWRRIPSSVRIPAHPNGHSGMIRSAGPDPIKDSGALGTPANRSERSDVLALDRSEATHG